MLLLVGQVSFLFADESEFFFKSVSIVRVYPHRLGYRILYARTNMDLGEMYVPMTWFQYDQEAGGVGKGELVIGNDDSYPYFSIFWKNGQFNHIRLYLQENRGHESWGNIPVGSNWDARFDIDTLEDLKF